MKKINLFYVVIFLWMGLGLSSCKDDSAVDFIDDGSEEEIIVELPTEDQMTELCEVPVAVWGNGFSRVAEAFVKRIQHAQSEITEDTQVILFKGDAIYDFTDEQFELLNEATSAELFWRSTNPRSCKSCNWPSRCKIQVLRLATLMKRTMFLMLSFWHTIQNLKSSMR